MTMANMSPYENSPEIRLRHDLPNDETCTIPGTILEDSPVFFFHTDDIGDGTDTDHYTEPDAKANSTQVLTPE